MKDELTLKMPPSLRHFSIIDINVLAPELFSNFSTPCTQNLNNTGTKQVRIMKQTAF